MRDSECVALLQWALPQIGLRWRGFRRVRRQVCRRLASRLQELGLSDARAYAAYLERNPEEWSAFEAMCGITISRFFRDRAVFDALAERVLPELARGIGMRGPLCVWSAGCASGEEPYSIALLWELQLAPRFPDVELRVLATDRDPQLIARARRACYRPSSLRELPATWVERAFGRVGDELCLAPELRRSVAFEPQDLRKMLPPDRYQLILCRNLAFSYFDEPQQQRTLAALTEHLAPGGCLVIGAHEQLPEPHDPLQPLPGSPCIYRSVV